jgi:hypothetical protein
MSWAQAILPLAAGLVAATSVALAADVWPQGWDDERLIPLHDGSLARLRFDTNSLQIRSPAGEWSPVMTLPLDYVSKNEADDEGLLVVGEKLEARKPHVDAVLLLGPDGKEIDRWEFPNDGVRSVASRAGRRWATLMNRMVELLPGGKTELVFQPLPAPPDVGSEHGKKVQTRTSARLQLGPSGERVFCVPEESHHDGPCHYGFCYRNDNVIWNESGTWTEIPLVCGDYLVEPERRWSRGTYPLHHHHRIVVRRISDGVKVAAAPVQPSTVVECGAPGAVLLADTSVRAVQLSTGRRPWSAPVRSGHAVAIAQVGGCTTVLTNRGMMTNICRDGHALGRQHSQAGARP